MLESIPSLKVTEEYYYHHEEEFLLRDDRLDQSSAARWEEVGC